MDKHWNDIFKRVILGAAAIALMGSLSATAFAQDKESSSPQTNPNAPFRNFYQVLEDLMADFEYDLKNGQVNGLRDLSIRNVATSENIPASFKAHLELVLTERVIRTTKARMIQCLPCKAKRTTLTGEQVVISAPETNPVELARIAKLSGIANFMDVAFSYQPSGMILSMTITDPENGMVVWSRTYNSETSRASAFRRGVDYSQIDDNARKMTEYQPTIQHRAIVYYLFERDYEGYTGVLGLGYRMVERYDNRKKEVGFEVDYFKQASSLVGGGVDEDGVEVETLYGGLNLTLLFIHAWNLIGDEENYNNVRGSVIAGVGGTYASGFLGGLVRGGYEWRLAKHWAVSGTLGYRPSATPFIDGTAQQPVSGVEFGIGISGLF